MKVTVGPSSNVVFQAATDRGVSSQINVTQNNATKVTFSAIASGGGGGSSFEAYNQANNARNQANAAYARANALTIQEIYASNNVVINSYSNVNTIQFDNDSGFSVIDEANGIVAIEINSTFKTWNVNGAPGLVATGLDTVNFIGQGINITANNYAPKSITFTSSALDAYSQANSARSQANNSYGQANSARTQANTARDQANAARDQANTARDQANLKLNVSGGTISGNLVVSGNLEVLGNSTILNVETLFVEDNEIVLNSNTSGAPVFNAYITINRGSSPNANIVWNEDTNQWQWNDGDSNYFSFDTSLDAYAQANAAYNEANTRVLKSGDTMTGTLNINFNGVGLNVNNSVEIAKSLLVGNSNTGVTVYDDVNDFAAIEIGGVQGGYIDFKQPIDEDYDFRIYNKHAQTEFISANTQHPVAFTGANVSFDTNTFVIDVVNKRVGVGTNTPTANLEVVGIANVSNTISTNTVNFGFGVYDLTSNTFQTTSNDPIEVDSFSAAAFTTVKYIVQVKTGSSLHSTELFCIQDGISTYMTEYATLISGTPLGSFSINLSGGRMKLNFVPDNPLNNILTFKVVRYTISS